jgi:hypothetical protein
MYNQDKVMLWTCIHDSRNYSDEWYSAKNYFNNLYHHAATNQQLDIMDFFLLGDCRPHTTSIRVRV